MRGQRTAQIRERIGTILERLVRLREGKGFGRPLEETGVYPRLAVQMIMVGEESGRLEEMLARVADVYDREVQVAVKRFLAILEPALILGLAVLIGGIVLSILLGVLGISAALLMVLVGNWYVPWSEQQLTLHRAQFSSRQSLNLGHGGTWLRERRDMGNGSFHNITVNVGTANNQGHFGLVRIFEFDAQGRLLRRLSAEKANVEALGEATAAKGSIWHLQNVVDTQWLSHDLLSEQAVQQGARIIDERQHKALDWQSSLTPLVVSASVLPPETMSTAALWRYTQHLATNAQAAQRYEIEFWKKTFYPLVCLVMVALALPFAYLHARSGGMSLKIFGGIMLGISFVLINHISSHLGLLHQWQPWLAAAAPSLAYLLLSMTAFVWLVRYR